MTQSRKIVVGVVLGWCGLGISAGLWAAEPTAGVSPISLAQAEQNQNVPATAPAEAETAAPGPISAAAAQPAPAPAVAASQPADPVQAFIAKVKSPVPWFKWGADYRIRDEYSRNGFGLDKHNALLDTTDWMRHRLRIWSTLSLGDFLDFNSRIVWEGRNWFEPEESINFDNGEVMFDLLNLALKKPAGLPFTIIAGRQEISLGDRWLVFDGTPLDGSRTLYFDAIRLTLDLAQIKTKIDTIYIDQDAKAEHWFGMIKHRDRDQRTGANAQRYIVESDERGAIVWVENKSVEATELDGYFIYKNDRAEAPRFGNNADIYTFGGRMVHDFNQHLRLRDEIAPQFGHKNGNNLCALASLNRLSYSFNDKLDNSLRMDYEYLSGDRRRTGTDEGFDVLWGRWPRFSELWVYLQPIERRPADYTNLHRLAWGWTIHLTPKTEMATDYHLLFAAQNTQGNTPQFSSGGKFRGQLVTWVLRHAFTPQLSGHLVAEMFVPGDFYDERNNDIAQFLRAEMVFAF